MNSLVRKTVPAMPAFRRTLARQPVQVTAQELAREQRRRRIRAHVAKLRATRESEAEASQTLRLDLDVLARVIRLEDA